MNVLFRTNNGNNINIVINKDKTIRELILEFFNKIEKKIYNENDIYFIYNAQKINYNENKKIGDFFGMSLQPKIYVNNARDLIGAN